MTPATTPAWLTVGWLIALLVLVLAIVFAAIGKLDFVIAGMFVGLALARLLP